ncbi:alpha/beta hydrolase [Mycobacterium intermedium]|uniref:Alpha/beta hydrolase n=1 Tax=Mycobacterium intermedium TaxID=28445 RepID=A0A1E3SJ90_MYCIE|nr:alpha/beta fold hydrolase [Mycobacterium intermedium]MCV6963863.1 alpha/beta hydrolase [Mycobacterium intermedium]ODR02162.1 thioesterase [Mycobacterium intermedium]OPE52679.1 alpha/beta hydrolase [Mycobacterium intermedium]ORB10210.1 alpha/beta hydrolase [Mycobacterium intermedium]
MSNPRPRVVIVDSVPMSGVIAAAENPKAVVVAIHGGGTTAVYFDCPGHPELSLLRMGPTLGFTVIALDRPGHGSSAPYPEAVQTPQQRVDLAYGAVDRILGQQPRGAGLFLLGHSGGCELATRMAADQTRGPALLGLELGGTGRRYHDAAKEIMKAAAIKERPPGTRELLWEPMRLYPPDILRGITNSAASPPYERDVALNWPHRYFPELAASVRVPVRFTLGEHDRVYRSDDENLAEIAEMFTQSPLFTANTQPDAGHNLSLGRNAADYHRKVFAFVDQCVARSAGDAAEAG